MKGRASVPRTTVPLTGMKPKQNHKCAGPSRAGVALSGQTLCFPTVNALPFLCAAPGSASVSTPRVNANGAGGQSRTGNRGPFLTSTGHLEEEKKLLLGNDRAGGPETGLREAPPGHFPQLRYLRSAGS